MASSDRPFSDTEKVNLLAEIIKASPVPPAALLDIIYQYNIQPPWHEFPRPPGRSNSECRQAFDDLCQAHPYQYFQPRPPASVPQQQQQPPPPPLSAASAAFIHRPYEPPPPSSSNPSGRSIQPRPEGVPPSVYTPRTSPYTPAPTSSDRTPPKKRGRPSNAELEIRRQEFLQRGEPYPTPRSRKRKAAQDQPPKRHSSLDRGPTAQTSKRDSLAAPQKSPDHPGDTTSQRPPTTMEPPPTTQQPPFHHHPGPPLQYEREALPYGVRLPQLASISRPPTPSSSTTRPPSYTPSTQSATSPLPPPLHPAAPAERDESMEH